MIEEKINEIVASNKVSAADGFLYELYDYFGRYSVFEKFKSWRSSDTHNMLRAKATISEDVDKLRPVIKALEEIFSEIAWSLYAARSIETYSDFLSFRFFTTCKGDTFTTGSFDVGGNHYRELIRKEERHFASRTKKNPYKIDFSDFEEVLSTEEWEKERKERDWSEHAQIIDEIEEILERLAPLTKMSHDEFCETRIYQDSAAYNLSIIQRQLSELTAPYELLRPLRKSISEVIILRNRPWLQDPDALFEILRSTLPLLERELASIVESRKNRDSQ